MIPQFVNPLSTKEDSIIDQRLVGHWELVEIDVDGIQTASDPNDAYGEYIILGRHSDQKDSMIAAQTKLKADGQVEHESRVGIATRLDNANYITWELQPKELNPSDQSKPTKTAYSMTTYTLQDNDTLLTMFMLDYEHLIEAIKEGRLAGVIEEEVVLQKGKEKTEIRRVIIESSTAELREYFTKFGSVAFNRREPSYYRKVIR
ncbi:MAG: hypothetical protein ACKVK0_02335 [Pirellulales bacterium]